MVESKQIHVQLAAAPASTLHKEASPMGFQECLDLDRINVLDLKARIVKTIGTKRANRYFAQFVAFIGSRLSKPQFDKLVVVTIGKENIALHNQLVKAILSNTIKGRAPPPLPPSPSQKISSKHHSTSVTSTHTILHTSPSTLSTGDSLLSSPRSARSTARHSRDRDYRVSPLGHSEAHSALTFSQPVQQLDIAAKQLDAESNSSLEPPTKRVRTDCPVSDDSVSGVESEVILGEESILHKEEREGTLPPPCFGSSIKGSLGFPFHLESRDACRRPALDAFPAQLLLHGGLDDEIQCASDLPDGDTMHSLIKQVAIGEGLAGASRECADIVNIALDAYLRRLIKSCGAVGGAESSMVREDTSNGGALWDMVANGSAMKLQHSTNGGSLRSPSELIKKKNIQNEQSSISLMDLKVAMDMDPWQLGDNWAVQLEKILFHIDQ